MNIVKNDKGEEFLKFDDIYPESANIYTFCRGEASPELIGFWKIENTSSKPDYTLQISERPNINNFIEAIKNGTVECVIEDRDWSKCLTFTRLFVLSSEALLTLMGIKVSQKNLSEFCNNRSKYLHDEKGMLFVANMKAIKETFLEKKEG